MNNRTQQRLEKDIDNLRTFLSRFNTVEVLGAIANTLVFNKEDLIGKTGLVSPYKELLYLAGLLLSTEQQDSQSFDKKSFEKAKKFLQKITVRYAELFFPSKQEFQKGLTEQWKKTRELSMPVFLNYFNTTPLCVQEQVIDRTRQWFSKFDDFIENETGLTTDLLIDIFLYLQKYLESQLNTLSELKIEYRKKHKEFFDSLGADANLTIEELRESAQKHSIKNALEALMDQVVLVHHISFKELEDKFGKSSIDNFLNIFSIERCNRDFRYYTEPNPVESSPIWRASNEHLLCPFLEQLLNAIHNFLYSLLENSKHRENFYKRRDTQAEKKTRDLFEDLFNEKAKYFESIFEDNKAQNEHDLVILFYDVVLIVEVKAPKLKEPFRDPEKALVRIKRDFKSDKGIQKAYDQGLRLKQLILSNSITNLYDKKGSVLAEIDRNAINKIYILSITVEQMGIVATNLSLLLDKPEDEPYPWSTNLYDLETIIDGLNYKKLPPEQFLDYLNERARLHEKLFSWDELEICGFYLTYGGFQKLEKEQADIYQFTYDMSQIFDKIYFEKHGIEFDFQFDEEPTFFSLDSAMDAITKPKRRKKLGKKKEKSLPSANLKALSLGIIRPKSPVIFRLLGRSFKTLDQQKYRYVVNAKQSWRLP